MRGSIGFWTGSSLIRGTLDFVGGKGGCSLTTEYICLIIYFSLHTEFLCEINDKMSMLGILNLFFLDILGILFELVNAVTTIPVFAMLFRHEHIQNIISHGFGLYEFLDHGDVGVVLPPLDLLLVDALQVAAAVGLVGEALSAELAAIKC